MTTTRRLRLAATAVVAVLAVLPFAVAGRISLGIFVFIGLFSLIVIGLSLLAGHAGQVSLGQAAFYGLGAYIAAITTLRSEEHTSELQSRLHLVCRLLLEKKKKKKRKTIILVTCESMNYRYD